MEKRTLLALLLSLLILFLWQSMIRPPERPQVETTKPVEIAKSTPTSAVESKKEEEFPLPPPEGSFKGEDIYFKHPLFVAIFSTKGAALRSFSLTQYKRDFKPDAESIDLIQQEQINFLPLSLYSSDPEWKDLPTLPFRLVQNRGDTVEFFYEDSKRSISKRFIFKENQYEFDVVASIKFKGKDLPSDAGLILSDIANQGQKPSFLNPGAQENKLNVYSAGKVEKVPFATLAGTYQQKKVIDWIAFDSKYFLTAIVPSAENEPIEVKGAIIGDKVAVVRYSQPFSNKEEIVLKAKGFFGPKLSRQLNQSGHNLEAIIDWGMFEIIAVPLLKLLNVFYSFFHNYGIAIILLTVLIKLLFYPLSQKSMKSMREMQRIQPQIQALKETHKEDKEKLNREMINLMKTNNVSPMGGCLPLLFQMPVFFALYRVLYASAELYHAPFFGWIHDLSAKDPYFVTPLAMGVLMVVQQKMTPSSADPIQKQMMVFMPILFTFLMLFLPAGLTIYMLVNSILTIAQQYLSNKSDSVTHKIQTGI